MNFPVIKAVGFILVHAPNIMMEHGTTITMERKNNPQSEYLHKASQSLRSFEEAVQYAPNQVFIGNLTPHELQEMPKPWYQNLINNDRQGKYGEIIPENEFYAVMKIADSFQLVELEEAFAARSKEILTAKRMFNEKQLGFLNKASSRSYIEELVNSGKAEGLYENNQLVGCVRQAHESDPNLSATIVFENLVAKASGILALKNLLRKNNLDAAQIDYIIETSEEAIGDMNQRGGGNLAKAIGEAAECNNATGVDMRAFCAGPAHGILTAAALVQSGIFKNVVVMAGGSSAKLGMNSRDHVNKEMPVLEDMVGGYAILISENDGRNPIIRTDIVGRHKISSGSSPQAVIQAIVVDPLEKVQLRLIDVDVYAPELQNAEITSPAGAGDVPLANYKMIGAMAVKRGEISRDELPSFVSQHGVTGFAPTQGHIPSGVPLLGYIRDNILTKKMQRAMLIGKGSLFLGRMTDLFDGISFIIEPNQGIQGDCMPSDNKEESKQEIRNMLADAMQELARSMSGGRLSNGE
ncbi:MAG TPA: glycine/sarcosine/betaine reductase complex component C subunit beta [Syntrophomonas sp.]|nr:glycine/sarcosine/betaine reductase complex component C subunit beta [Syntrophomonas sp.]HRW11676.1 glycine/sarcosine/betaine reductase complex component C subunit beta [Syntrophomonas sp.]